MQNAKMLNSKIKQREKDFLADKNKCENRISDWQKEIARKQIELSKNKELIDYKSRRALYNAKFYLKGHVRHIIEDFLGIIISVFLLYKTYGESDFLKALLLLRDFNENETNYLLLAMLFILLFFDLINNSISVILDMLSKHTKKSLPSKTKTVRYSIYAGFNILNLLLICIFYFKIKSYYFPRLKISENFVVLMKDSPIVACSVLLCVAFLLFFFGSLIYCIIKILQALMLDKGAKKESLNAVENEKNLNEKISLLEADIKGFQDKVVALKKSYIEDLKKLKLKGKELYAEAVKGDEVNEKLMKAAASYENESACAYIAKEIMLEYHHGQYTKKEKEEGMKIALSYAEVASNAGDNEGLFVEGYILINYLALFFGSKYWTGKSETTYYEKVLRIFRAMHNQKLLKDERLSGLLEDSISYLVSCIDALEEEKKEQERKKAAEAEKIRNQSYNNAYYDEPPEYTRPTYVPPYDDNSSYLGFSSKSAYDTATDLYGMEVQNNICGGGIDASGM